MNHTQPVRWALSACHASHRNDDSSPSSLHYQPLRPPSAMRSEDLRTTRSSDAARASRTAGSLWFIDAAVSTASRPYNQHHHAGRPQHPTTSITRTAPSPHSVTTHPRSRQAQEDEQIHFISMLATLSPSVGCGHHRRRARFGRDGHRDVGGVSSAGMLATSTVGGVGWADARRREVCTTTTKDAGLLSY